MSPLQCLEHACALPLPPHRPSWAKGTTPTSPGMGLRWGAKGSFPPPPRAQTRGCPEEQLLPTRWTDRILLLQRP